MVHWLRSPILLIPALLLSVTGGQAQGRLQVQTPEDRVIAAGQTHRYGVSLMKDQRIEIDVYQGGIDVGVTVTDPTGVAIGVFDTADGTAGIETVTFVAESAGEYRVAVAPLDEFLAPAPGRYRIVVVEVRNATDQELAEGRRERGRAVGLSLIGAAVQSLGQVRNLQARAALQLRSANLLAGIDDASALSLLEQTRDSLLEFFATFGGASPALSEDFQAAMEVRHQVLEALIPRDPEIAISFIRATRGLTDPETGFDESQQDRLLELSAANRLATSNPRRALEIARETLREEASPEIVDTVRALQAQSPDLAAALARDIYAALLARPLLADAGTANLAVGLVRLARQGGRTVTNSGRNGAAPLLSSADFRNLYQKMVAEVLSYSPPESGSNTAVKHAARMLASSVKDLDEFRSLPPDRAAAITRKITQLSAAPTSLPAVALDINTVPLEQGILMAEAAPPEMRDLLYLQLATRAASSGDIERARRIVDEHLRSPARQKALATIQRLAVAAATDRGDFETALRIAQSERSRSARIAMLEKIVPEIGPGLKKSTAAFFLEQARSALDPSARAGGEEEMRALLQIGSAYAPLNSDRGFEIVDPLVDQFNDLSGSALGMNGFREDFYRDGELITYNGNILAEIAEQLEGTLSDLSLVDPSRAVNTASRIQSAVVRVGIYLEIAQKALHPPVHAE
ncbi:MAG TPA: PPC domain-containing protein [Terriglobia bacterium]|nr:PPC domain-containing protein [Terriglobia bacterium]